MFIPDGMVGGIVLQYNTFNYRSVTHPEHMRSSHCLSFFRITASDYPFCIFNYFLHTRHWHYNDLVDIIE